ncbi:MAG TPA: phenylacetate-CoA oxygenase subunit PaaJ [Ferruginibacter sp.]|nr:phenylacetate-CoA oxygenase subunit PaaJ [Ferruginibacter sp.]HPH92907.1 phenylacetate-CoA oxygenase subunit PaaJ [Ferruginibacter sp.]
MQTATIDKKTLYTYLEEIKDPEVPVLSIIDLGIVREVTINGDELEVIITPTYTGCPAMDLIAATIKIELATLGFKKVKVTTVLAPAWTTDWMTEEGKRKLKAYGIAPPNPKQHACSSHLFAEETVQCPQCNSYHTHRVSEFGSTACKSLYQCDDCKEPFDYFKCH